MRRRSNPLSERNIKRIDTRVDALKQTHGFQVCISCAGSLHTKHFSDSLFGGIKGSLKKARAHRDAKLAEMPPLEASRIAHTSNIKNKSGHLGISFRSYKTTKGKVVNLIAVSVRAEKGKTVSRIYRYEKEDREQMLAEAIAFREKLLNERLKREGGVAGIVRAKSTPAVSKPAAVKKKVAAKKAVKAVLKKAPTKKAVTKAVTKKTPAKKAKGRK